MEDFHRQVGGVPSLLKYLFNSTNLLHGDTPTITGLTLKDSAASATDIDFELQNVIRPLERPIWSVGNIQILRGNLAPGGSVSKITGKQGTYFRGKALCFDKEEDFNPALASGLVTPGTVIVLRYQGPRGAPGMPGLHTVSCG